jgi:hypothetical protein
MVPRFAAFAAAVVLVLIFFLMQVQDREPARTNRALSIRRLADVTMVERALESGRVIRIRAREVSEEQDEVARLLDFRVEHERGATISGRRALYDRRSSLLTVPGPIDVTAPEGITIHLNSLVWDTISDTGSTDREVTIRGKGGFIRAGNAAFSGMFSTITLSGGVRAEIERDILGL